MELYDAFTTDKYGTVTIGEWGGWYVQVVPMIFNDRLVLTPKHSPFVYDFGWCYDKGPAPYVAAKVWDPQTQAEPPGYKKAAAGGRRAGQLADDDSPGLTYAAMLGAILGVRLTEPE